MADTGWKVIIGAAAISAVAAITSAYITSHSKSSSQQAPKLFQPLPPTTAQPLKPESKTTIETAPDIKSQARSDTPEARRRARKIVQQLTTGEWELLTHTDDMVLRFVLDFHNDWSCEAKVSREMPGRGVFPVTCTTYSVLGDSVYITVEAYGDFHRYVGEYALKQEADGLFRGTETDKDPPTRTAELKPYR